MSIRSDAILLAAVLIASASMMRQTTAQATTATAAESLRSVSDNNPIAHLNEMLGTGRTQLRFEPRSGYLGSVLTHLRVPVESQVVTFSQASLHGGRVTDSYPRAILFSDDVAIAWTPASSTLELAAYSRQRGLVFYGLEQSPSEMPHFQERRECLACHKSERTLDVPGLFVLSAPRKAGAALIATDHRTPLANRWGAWYVTGLSRGWRHQGNRIGQGWLVSLYDQFDTSGYPTLYSDIVALMVFEHQTHLSNLIGRAQALFQTDPTGKRAAVAIDELADYMLFVDEAPIPARIVGTAGFAEWFSNRTPRDPAGRSLYQLDLKRRLFVYPVSYMIYSVAFDRLPQAVKEAVYARLLAALTASADGGYPGVSVAEKAATLEILASTKPDFRDFVERRNGDVFLQSQ